MEKQRIYFCIDMKTFFASVECADRGLNPFETNLIVADVARGKNAICLAISPKMKSQGIHNRCRLSEIPPEVKYISALPRMKRYIEVTGDIYEIYLDYFSKDDIHVYSIDEAFIDVTDYLKIYKTEPIPFAKKLLNVIAEKTHIPATAGIGTNMYLAKIALDITAKHTSDHIGFLDEELYKKTLWEHRPLSDFWGIGEGTITRLAKYGIKDQKGIAMAPESILQKEFGINSEILIDHAFGRESCRMEDIKNYKGKTKSVSNTQILFKDYDFDKALIVLLEMAITGTETLAKRHLVTNHIGIMVSYSKGVYPSTVARMRMSETTNVFSVIEPYIKRLFCNSTIKGAPIRQLGIEFLNVVDEGCEGYDMFADMDYILKEKNVEKAVLDIKDKFGKNAILRGINFEEGATGIERNKMIGGHNSGEQRG